LTVWLPRTPALGPVHDGRRPSSAKKKKECYNIALLGWHDIIAPFRGSDLLKRARRLQACIVAFPARAETARDLAHTCTRYVVGRRAYRGLSNLPFVRALDMAGRARGRTHASIGDRCEDS
jgi:hypothetical protein